MHRIARPMLAAIFISGGIEALRRPTAHAEVAEPVLDVVVEEVTPVAQRMAAAAIGSSPPSGAAGSPEFERAVEWDGDAPVSELGREVRAPDGVGRAVHEVAAGGPLPFSGEDLVRANAVVQVGAGALLAIGKAPRLASLLLAASLVPTTLGGHRFWEVEDEDRRRRERIAFTKDIGLLGGLLLSATAASGDHHRIERAADAVTEDAAGVLQGAAGAAHHGVDVAHGAAQVARHGVEAARRRIDAASELEDRIPDVSGRVQALSDRIPDVSSRLQELSDRIPEVSSRVQDASAWAKDVAQVARNGFAVAMDRVDDAVG